MTNSLVILGADFSANAIQSVISEEQTDAGGFYSESTGSLVTNIPQIKGVAKIPCPGATAIYFKATSTGVQTPALVCWDANDVFLGSVQSGSTIGIPTGDFVFNLPPNTAKFSYVYSNTYLTNNWNVGLESEICKI